ncbi:hypothetical protein RIF29_33587 [Crotalaria pallida]|uniref:Protein kinase domain-containing protein n=1 Tax=Crotalaria pallida TaxID=3830 RepID=A0AAN9EAT3_CROPI
MAQRRPLLSHSDMELIRQLSRSLARLSLISVNNNDVAATAKVKDDFVFDIDSSLLVDSDKLFIGELTAEGPRSIVCKGWYELRPVSIKVRLPLKTMDATPECKAKFQREVNLLSRIEHKNIVKFIGASIEPSMMIITELTEGGSLQKHLESIKPRTLSLEQSVRYALDISQVMEYLHANGIIHRDLRPGNMLLSKDKKLLKLADFRIAREETCGEMTSEAGSYRYMAPEVFSKEPLAKGAKKCYDHKADVYSFGMVLWTLIKNKIPFKGRIELMAAYATAQNMRPSVDEFPEVILPLLQSCWKEDPKLRPEFAEITQTLTKVLHDCRSPGTVEIESENPLTIAKEEECPTLKSLAPSPGSMEDNNEQNHQTQNRNDCTKGGSHNISHTPKVEFVEDNCKQKYETLNKNPNGCKKGQSHTIVEEKTPILDSDSGKGKTKKTHKRCKGLLSCLCR